MSDQMFPPEWLPEGWSMEVRVRKNGKKDKYYTDPSNELKFCSKPEVLRYLGNKEDDHEKSEIDDGSQKQSASNIVVEKAAAEGLPPGWIKEVRVKRKANKIRRDPYYIDPTNNHVFRSMKEVFRYLENEEQGNSASEQREDECICIDKIDNSPVKSEEKKLDGNETAGQVNKQNAISCEKGSSVASLSLCETNDSVQSVEKDNSLDSAHEVSTPPESLPSVNEFQMNENAATQQGSRKSKRRKVSDLPRRSSKRLAGIKVDPPLELKTKSVQVLAAAKQSGEAETTPTLYPEKSEVYKTSAVIPVEKTDGEIQTEKSNVKTEQVKSNGLDKILPGEINNTSCEKPESWMDVDPCIEFAIKTLTGAIPIDDNKAVENPGSVEIEYLPSKNLESSSMLPEFLWSDPCIEFAVKTLTGEIPVQDYFQKPLTTSKTRGQNALSLANPTLDHFHRPVFLPQHLHFQAADKSLHKQDAVMMPHKNILSRNSTSNGLYQHFGGRNIHRPTMI